LRKPSKSQESKKQTEQESEGTKQAREKELEKEGGGEMKEDGKQVNENANDVLRHCVALVYWLVGSGLIAESVSQRICS
jgi:hypothetical protein